jgi:ATP:corrinoid adenosyltransferase
MLVLDEIIATNNLHFVDENVLLEHLSNKPDALK